MRISLAALTIALSFTYWKVSGMLVEVMVRPGNNATLHCDLKLIAGQDIHWVRTCSSSIQPPLIISAYDTLLLPVPRFSVVLNNASKSYDLLIENITEADLGLYYCSTVEKKQIEHEGILFEKAVYHIGGTLTKLTYKSSKLTRESLCFSEASCETVSDCQQCWLALLTLCPVCSLISATLAFVCGCCYHKTVLNKARVLPSISQTQGQDESLEQDNHEEVCYTSLNIPKHGSKLTRSKQLMNPDFSVYNDIKIIDK